MSIVVDSSVWIEATTRAPGWHRFSPYLAKTGELLIPSVVIAEVGFLRGRVRTGGEVGLSAGMKWWRGCGVGCRLRAWVEHRGLGDRSSMPRPCIPAVNFSRWTPL